MEDDIGYIAEVWYSEKFGSMPMASDLEREEFASLIETVAKEIEERDFPTLWRIFYNRNYGS